MAKTKAAFTREEQLLIKEVARTTLADANLFEWVCNKMDVNDNHLRKLWRKLERHLNPGRRGIPNGLG